jgi:SAM-dependent methyltransferase
VTTLPPNASVVRPLGGSKLFAPSADRNVDAIVALVHGVAPAQGRALEIASGTGQHVTALAAALPQLTWHPSELATDRIASIDAYAAEVELPNLHAALFLDATQTGWAATHHPYDLIYFGNLLHLISLPAAQTLLEEAAQALEKGGILVVYGPFARAGVLTSAGDATFDAELRATDPAIGYKDDRWLNDVLTCAGLHLSVRNMPANNLAFIASRSPQ